MLQLMFPSYESIRRPIQICMSLCCSVTQLCVTPCDPKDCSMPCLPVLHQLLEFPQTHVH